MRVQALSPSSHLDSHQNSDNTHRGQPSYSIASGNIHGTALSPTVPLLPTYTTTSPYISPTRAMPPAAAKTSPKLGASSSPLILGEESSSASSPAMNHHALAPHPISAGTSQDASHKYYQAGSSEIVTETKLTVSRLETRRKLTKTSDRLVIVLVGLPARGKSFISRKLLHYVNWTGVKCKAFNVGKYRREAYAQVVQSGSGGNGEDATTTTEPANHGDHSRHNNHNPAPTPDTSSKGACDANFFAAGNAQAAALRQRVAQMALDDMLAWLDEEGEDYWDEACNTSSVSLASLRTSQTRHHHHHVSQKIAIFDATNSTERRRQWILEQCTSPERRGDKKTGVVFVESICEDQELLMENYRFKVSNSPDYKDMTLEEGLADLLQRVRNYEEQYETIRNDNISYIKIFDLSTKLMVNHIYGRMSKDLVPALMAWHIGSRPIFLLRPGRTVSGVHSDATDVSNSSLDAVMGPSMFRRMNSSASISSKRRRGDALCPEGIAFRRSLWNFLLAEVKEFILKRRSTVDNKSTGTSISGLADQPRFHGDGAEESEEVMENGALPVRVLTSTMPRAVETVSFEEFDVPCSQMSNLNPIDKGDFAGMELDDMKTEDPVFFQQLQADPFSTRFPGGESYHDLVRRLKTVVIDMEQQVVPVVVVSHVSILQCLMAYFRNTPVQNCMTAEVPMHTVIKFEPARGGGWQESWHALDTRTTSEDNGMVAVPSMSEFSVASAITMDPEHSTHGENPIWEAETGPIHRTSFSRLRKQATT